VRPIYAIRPGHRGDLSLPDGQTASAAIAWSRQRGGTYIPTPLLYGEYLYTVNVNGIIACYHADTGEQVYETRVAGTGGAFSASPIAADGRLYVAAETGEVYVLRAGEKQELLAKNEMGEVVMATPALSDGLLVVRTLGHVIGIEDQMRVAQ
jgi:outer membrane protein assembly factor BamB